jgi:hypothetical protein
MTPALKHLQIFSSRVQKLQKISGSYQTCLEVILKFFQGSIKLTQVVGATERSFHERVTFSDDGLHESVADLSPVLLWSRHHHM